MQTKQKPKYPTTTLVILLTLFLSFHPTTTHANLMLWLDGSYKAFTDDGSDGEFNQMKFNFYAAATMGKREKWALGWNVVNWSVSQKLADASGEAETSLMEMGPRLLFFFKEERLTALSIAWHPYVVGDRKVVSSSSSSSSGGTEDVRGSALYAGLHFMFKVSKRWRVGVSINYHSTSLSKSTDSSNTESDVSDGYSDIYPSLSIAGFF